MAIRIRGVLGHCRALILVFGQCLAPCAVLAQEAAVPLQFNYADPGARSLGFGGAFVALADDATAAFANPAGLVQILRPEVSMEWRHWSYSTPYTEGGRAEGLPSGIGIDSTVGSRTATSEVDTSGIAFLSFVYPRGSWSFAVYRHRLADFEFFSETQGLFGGGSDCCQVRDFDMRAENRLEILSHGFSVAYRVSETLDLGVGIVHYDMSFTSDATLFRTDDDSIESFFAPNSYLPQRTVISERLFVDDTDTAMTAGVLWRPSERWRLGGVYRQALEVDFGVELTAGETFDPGVPPGELLFRTVAMLEMPEIYGLGLAYRDADGRLTVSLQWNRINYSSIVDSLGLEDRAIDDADELRMGAEYVFLGVEPVVALRLGVWREPDHRIRNNSDNAFAEALLPRGEDETHFSVGLGVAMSRFQIDVAADFADHLDTVSVSAIYNFRL